VLFAVWPYQIDRFLHPLIPLLVTLLLYGIGVAAPRLHIAARRAVFAAAALVAVTAFTRTAHRIAEVSGCDRSGPLPDLRCVNIEERSFLRAAAYIRGMLPTSARVVSGHSEALYYHTNRVTVRSSVVDAPDSSRFVAAMRRADVAYILLSGLSPAERSSLAPKLSPNCQLLRETAFFPPHTYLLQVALSDTADSGVRPLPRTTELPETSGCAALEQYFRDTDGKPQSVHAP
jgi:hypothetical protein